MELRAESTSTKRKASNTITKPYESSGYQTVSYCEYIYNLMEEQVSTGYHAVYATGVSFGASISK